MPMLIPGQPWIPSKNVRPFGSAVYPAISNIYRVKSFIIQMEGPV